MCHLSFRKLFFEVTSKYAESTSDIDKVYTDVIKKYSSKGRYYHGINHIYKMCDLWVEHKDKIVNPDVVFFSIVFHDIIYKPRRSDNEEKSTSYFFSTAIDYFHYMHYETILRIRKFIAQTKHGRVQSSYEGGLRNDLFLFLDFDLSVLSSSEDEYNQYAKDIRKEYRIYPNFMYRPGRIKVLNSFLNKDRIYLSDEFLNKEEIARKNIENEINLLTLKKI